MKTIVIVLTIFCVTVLGGLTDEQKAMMKELKEVCISETGVDSAVIDNAESTKQIPAGDDKFDCFVTCMLKKTGLMNEDESINMDLARTEASEAGLSQEEINHIADACQSVSGNGCAIGSNLLKCFMDNKTPAEIVI